MAIHNRNSNHGYYCSSIMIFICSMLMFITSHLLIAHDCSHEHRYSRLWWYDVKNNASKSMLINNLKTVNNQTINTKLMHIVPLHWNSKSSSLINQNNNGGVPTDNELMTQASKLSSKMTRIMVPNIISNGHINPQNPPYNYQNYNEQLNIIRNNNKSNRIEPNQNSAIRTTRFDDDDDDDDDGEKGPELFPQKQQQQQVAQFRKEAIYEAEPENSSIKNGQQEKLAASNSRPFFQSPSSSSSSFFDRFIQQPQQQQQQQQRQRQSLIQQNSLPSSNSYSDRIWNFFDTNINRVSPNQRQQSWKNFDQLGKNNPGSNNEDGHSSSSINSIVDSYIEKLLKRNQLRSNNSSSSSANLKNSKLVSCFFLIISLCKFHISNKIITNFLK
ncbi:uncharacterized protein LOC142645020 [Dermatophagoides pteronyssinus]|uniref:uncharacterized protein LOC142645020 n=1 Tax=Dermatophagoides pteronyssinus TaxID=6956 RepID=UPI003F668106